MIDVTVLSLYLFIKHSKQMTSLWLFCIVDVFISQVNLVAEERQLADFKDGCIAG